MSEHESSADKPRDIGLKAIRRARIERSQSKYGRISSRAWLVGLGSMLTIMLVAWIYRDRSLENQREELLSKQRAALTSVGSEWFPLRDTMEKTTIEASGPYKGDFVDPELAAWNFRSLPGIYLRMRLEDAKDVTSIREKADDSARDSFAGCLLRQENPSAAALARGEADAGSGWNDQPWNMRLAYFATRVLTDGWVADVKDTTDEIHLRVFVQQYERATTEEIPLAIEIIKRAQFFLLVLDEDVPEAQALTSDAGKQAGKVTWQELQQVPHPARIHLVDLRRGKEMLRLRRESDATFRFAGERTIRDPYTLAAMKRQVNNCALAQAVWAAIAPATEQKLDASVPDAQQDGR